MTAKLVFVSAALSIIAVTAPALAKDKSSGCGPGWYIADDMSLMSSATRATTDSYLFPTVTFGMTSGTSNCAKHTWVQNNPEAANFIVANIHNLQIETASAGGESLAALAKTFGCPESMNGQFARTMQANYEQIFRFDAANNAVADAMSDSQPELNSVVSGFFDTTRNDPELGKVCAAT